MCPKLVQVRSQESLLVLHGLVGSRSLYTNNTWLGHIVFVSERKNGELWISIASKILMGKRIPRKGALDHEKEMHFGISFELKICIPLYVILILWLIL
ncbi:unnamed protein product [Camellia sinensis]